MIGKREPQQLSVWIDTKAFYALRSLAKETRRTYADVLEIILPKALEEFSATAPMAETAKQQRQVRKSLRVGARSRGK